MNAVPIYLTLLMSEKKSLTQTELCFLEWRGGGDEVYFYLFFKKIYA